MALQFNNDLSSGIFYNSKGDYTLRSKGETILRMNADSDKQNTALGQGASHFNNSIKNTSIGYYAFGWSANSSNNTSIGTSAQTAALGDNNTSVGADTALFLRGNNNLSLGYRAKGGGLNEGPFSVGSDNTAVGCESMFYTLSGDLNTAIGYKSGIDLSQGYYNTFLGANTNIDNSANIYSYSTAIGYGAIIDTSNQIVIVTSNEYIYIPGGDLRFTDHSYNDTIKHDVSGTVRTLQATIQNEKRIALDTSGTNIYDASFHEFRNIGGTETRFSIHPDTIVLGHDSETDQITFSQQKKYIIQPSTIHDDICFNITKRATADNNIVSSYDGKIIAVAFPKDSIVSDTITITSKGAIIIYEMDISGQFQPKFSFSEVDMTGINENNFGHTMSMNKSGNKLVVGSNVDKGHGYIRRFQRNSNGSWYNMSGGIYEDLYSGVIEGSKLINVSDGDKFGYSVCLNDTGNIFAVNSAKSFHFFTWDLDDYRLVQQPAIEDTVKNFFISNAGDFIFTSVFVEVKVGDTTIRFPGGRLFFIKVDETLSEEYRAIYDISGNYFNNNHKYAHKKDSIASILTEDDDLYIVTKSKDKLIYLKGKGADINTNNIGLNAPPDPIALDTIAELDISENTLSLQMDSTGNFFSYVDAPGSGNHTTYIYRYDGSFNEMKTITGSNYEMDSNILHSAMSGNGRTLYNIHNPDGNNKTKLTSAYINLDYKVESSYLMTSSYNTALGADSLCDLRGTWYSGDHNSALGVQAGKQLQYGSRNTFLGANTDVDISNGVYENSTAIGYGATITESNQIVLGTTSESVKIPRGDFTFESTEKYYPNVDVTKNESSAADGSYNFLKDFYQFREGVPI